MTTFTQIYGEYITEQIWRGNTKGVPRVVWTPEALSQEFFACIQKPIATLP